MSREASHENSATGSDAEPLILVVDDNPANRKVAAYQLERLGVKCHAVSSGREAIEAVAGAHYDLVLMDCQMPGVDGFETCITIRQMEAVRGKRVPIVAMTAHAMEGDRERCLAAGMDDYICKPVDLAALGELMSRWLPPGRLHEPVTAPDRAGGPALPEAAAGPECVQAEDGGANRELLDAICRDPAGRESVQLFISSVPPLLSQLAEAVSKKNEAELKAAAHDLKGCCSILGAVEMHALIVSAEQAAVRQDWSEAAAASDALKVALSRFKQFLQRRIAQET